MKYDLGQYVYVRELVIDGHMKGGRIISARLIRTGKFDKLKTIEYVVHTDWGQPLYLLEHELCDKDEATKLMSEYWYGKLGGLPESDQKKYKKEEIGNIIIGDMTLDELADKLANEQFAAKLAGYIRKYIGL